MKAILDTIVSQMNSNGDAFVPVYGTNSWQNLLLDEAQFPIVAFDLPNVNYSLPKSGYIGETYPLYALIAYKSELEWTGSQHEDVLILANTATREFISRLQGYKDTNGNRLIDSIEFVSADRVKCVFDVCCTGILIRLNVKPTINQSVCLT